MSYKHARYACGARRSRDSYHGPPISYLCSLSPLSWGDGGQILPRFFFSGPRSPVNPKSIIFPSLSHAIDNPTVRGPVVELAAVHDTPI